MWLALYLLLFFWQKRVELHITILTLIWLLLLLIQDLGMGKFMGQETMLFAAAETEKVSSLGVCLIKKMSSHQIHSHIVTLLSELIIIWAHFYLTPIFSPWQAVLSQDDVWMNQHISLPSAVTATKIADLPFCQPQLLYPRQEACKLQLLFPFCLDRDWSLWFFIVSL